MIYVFFGGDAYSLRESLEELRARVSSPDLQAANTSAFTAQAVTLPLLVGSCATVPFLAERRLVIVEGLLATAERAQPASRPGGARGSGARGSLSFLPPPWEGLAAALKALPPTTDLVFVDGPLRRENPFLRELAPVAQLREFQPPTGPALESWIIQRVSQRRARITPEAVRLLAELIGPDLWALSNELEKLALYAGARPIEAKDVDTLVSPAREATVFAAVDAVLEQDSRRALGLVARLLDGGTTVTNILALLGRQVRQVLLAQDLLAQKVPQTELGPRLGIASAFPLRKTLEQARRVTARKLRFLHHLLLETDIAIKSGALEERLALEIFVARACHEA